MILSNCDFRECPLLKGSCNIKCSVLWFGLMIQLFLPTSQPFLHNPECHTFFPDRKRPCIGSCRIRAVRTRHGHAHRRPKTHRYRSWGQGHPETLPQLKIVQTWNAGFMNGLGGHYSYFPGYPAERFWLWDVTVPELAENALRPCEKRKIMSFSIKNDA